MGMGQTVAYAINVLNSHRNAASEFDAVSWYFPTFLNDEIIAVPLGVLLWHRVILAFARCAARRWPAASCLHALKASGRYNAESGGADDQRTQLVDRRAPLCGASLGCPTTYACGRRCDSAICGADPEDYGVRYDWWLTQLLWWCVCVVCSRLLGGMVVPAFAMALGHSSPYYVLARAIHRLGWSCDAKRWTFAGVLRLVIDVLQLALVDWFNKFHRPRRTSAVVNSMGLVSESSSTR